jgi:co-chaperonin GroES (HSP10)
MIKAINDVVIIERDTYQGKIIAPGEKMCHGTVISVGPGAWYASVHDIDHTTGKVEEKWRPTSLKVGERVCFSIDKGEEHVIEGRPCIVMRESHVAGVLEPSLAEAG